VIGSNSADRGLKISPSKPLSTATVDKGSVTVTNEKSWLRCRDLLSAEAPAVEASLVTQLSGDSRNLTPISRVNFVYPAGAASLALVHLIEVGDGTPGQAMHVTPNTTGEAIEVSLGGKTYVFSKRSPFTVSVK